MALAYGRDYETLTNRYSNSVIYHKKEPVYVRSVQLQGDQSVSLNGWLVGPAARQQPWKADSEDEHLADEPFNLGYMNGIAKTADDGEAFISCAYVERVPRRQWKQGLHDGIISFRGAVKFMTFQAAVGNKHFADMLKNQYPNAREAVASINGNTQMVAFNRRLAIRKTNLDLFELHYRGAPVGTSDDPFGRWRLADRFKYLRELIEQKGLVSW